MHYVDISTYQFIPYYASAIPKHTRTRILKPFEDSEPTGLKVDLAKSSSWRLLFYLPMQLNAGGPFVNFLCTVTEGEKDNKESSWEGK